MQAFETVTEALDALRKQGYSEDMNLLSDCLECHGGALRLHPEDFHVDQYFRFEGMNDPSDAAIVYAISSEKHGIKGVIVNGFGISSEPLTNAMLEKLK
ncbi:MAG: phosphoribosylpyrophosphate synthetase [Saprospiraceae bacterium]|nr:phosphoribosylpyrophosphate synthetase [Saprospiraceae bacterium]